jgi:cytoskeletal protein RodZ
MRTVGEALKEARESQQISLDQVASATKIRREYLLALEKGDFSALPSLASARGFLKNYAEFLGLSSKSILAIFRRDFIPKKEKKYPVFKIEWTPKATLILVVGLFFFILIFYLGYQYFSLRKSPFLEISSPSEGENVKESKIEIVGKTEKEALVTINDSPVLISENGDFSYQLELFSGENKIMIRAENKIGKKTEITRTIFRLDKEE